MVTLLKPQEVNEVHKSTTTAWSSDKVVTIPISTINLDTILI